MTANTAYINANQTNAADFSATYAEFALIGGNGSWPTYGISAGGPVTITSCTIRNGYNGIVGVAAAASTIQASILYANVSQGVDFETPSSGNQIIGNDIYANAPLTGATAVNLYFTSGNTVSQNVVHHNGAVGIGPASDVGDIVSSNTVFSNWSGIYLSNGSGSAVTGNVVYANSYGIYLSTAANNTFTANTVSTNTQAGVYLYNSSSNTLSGNTVYGNAAYGLSLAKSTGIVVLNGKLGYDAGGASLKDTSAEIFIDSKRPNSEIAAHASCRTCP